ncbi:hypothetical protein BDN72DRAFT_965718 [Pluteus cervinus]|uniref:Uncharacterized protein n=1 Tax=Pluteus cervinus TaxID=181527 RepID=A0ACD3A4Z0_9AGAR|nr:hypothetical protein BDN72DRAFT_965718 [Pluteus cervinus]
MTILTSTVDPTSPKPDVGPSNPTPVAVRGASRPDYKRHSLFWFDDRTMVYAAGDVLFRVSVGRLRYHSEVFYQIMGIPAAPGSKEGTEEVPLVLVNVAPKEFESFLRWVYNVDASPLTSSLAASTTFDEETLLHILKLSHNWECQDGVDFAFHQLDTRFSLAESHKLQLGCRYKFREWVGPAVRALMDTPFSSLSFDQSDQIGFHTYVFLTKAKDTVLKERSLMAAFPPVRNQDVHKGCIEARCDRIWSETWWSSIGMRIFHPTSPLPLIGIPAILHRTPYPGIIPECREASLAALVNHPLFLTEINIIEEVVGSILAHYAL